MLCNLKNESYKWYGLSCAGGNGSLLGVWVLVLVLVCGVVVGGCVCGVGCEHVGGGVG